MTKKCSTKMTHRQWQDKMDALKQRVSELEDELDDVQFLIDNLWNMEPEQN